MTIENYDHHGKLIGSVSVEKADVVSLRVVRIAGNPFTQIKTKRQTINTKTPKDELFKEKSVEYETKVIKPKK